MLEYDLVDQAYVIIRNTGLYNTRCDDWDTKDTPSDWTAFKKVFALENEKVIKYTTTQFRYSDEQAVALLKNLTNLRMR